MLTHKNITDKFQRELMCIALCTLRTMDLSLFSLRYISYPVHSRMYATFDIEEKMVIEIEYLPFGEDAQIRKIKF